MTSDTSEFWKITAESISKKLQNATSENLKVISIDEYLNLQSQRSIVFKFNSPLSGSVFVNLIGDNRNSNEINLSVDSIYISGSKNFYKLIDIKVDFQIDEILNKVREKGLHAVNFYEAYGIKKDIYIPSENYISLQKVSYISGLYNLEDDKKNALAERFLNVDSDFMRELSADGKNTYIYENEYLSLSRDGIIEYSLESLFDSKMRNLNKSLDQAVEFIAQKAGISSGIHSFIEIDVYSEFVKNYREYYIRKDDNPIYKKEKIYLTDIHRILNKNKKLFSYKSAMDILKNIDSLNLVYLSFNKFETEEPMLVYEMSYMDNIYYFNTEDGKLMMVR